MTPAAASILWKRLDREGHEAARLEPKDGRWLLSGAAIFAQEGEGCRLDYAIECVAEWNTVSARVSGWLGKEIVQLEILVDDDRGWRVNGTARPAVAGCVDIDLNFSPSTNLLPIRRLGLAVGEEAAVRAAWLRFPSFELEPLEQTYHRLSETLYRYESAGGRFVAELEVDAAGFVTRYPGFAKALY